MIHKIVIYTSAYERRIKEMMQEIALEFGEPISGTEADPPPLLPDAYWVALAEEAVAGTVGVTVPDNGYAVLKRMMVRRSFRGRDHGIADALLQRAVSWSRNRGCRTMYLGTMSQFKAAQQFYARHGFSIIAPAGLPVDFPHNPLDTVFYKRELDGHPVVAGTNRSL